MSHLFDTITCTSTACRTTAIRHLCCCVRPAPPSEAHSHLEGSACEHHLVSFYNPKGTPYVPRSFGHSSLCQSVVNSDSSHPSADLPCSDCGQSCLLLLCFTKSSEVGCGKGMRSPWPHLPEHSHSCLLLEAKQNQAWMGKGKTA